MKKVSVAVLLPGPKSSIKDFDSICDIPLQVCEAEYQSAEKPKDEDHNHDNEDHNHDSIFDFPSDDEGYKGDNDEDASIREVQWDDDDDDLKRRCDEFIAKQHKQWKEESINDKLDHNHLEENGGGMSEDLEYSEDNYFTAEEEFEATEPSM